MVSVSRKFCVAPMMDWTDHHFRYFARLISRHTLLYTEMITTGALIHGDRKRYLKYDPAEHPIAIQLGGSDPKELALCAKMAEDHGYDEINLNVGCPSDRVQNNMIGACLMAHPALVTECLSEIIHAVAIPVTIKHRIGIDDLDSDEYLTQFVENVSQSGCKTFIVHARKAILQGLNPKQNREVPPLDYSRVYQLKEHFPKLEIIINGGITSITQCQTHLDFVDGVMVGREAYQNPWLLSDVDTILYQDDSEACLTRHDIVEQMIPYIDQALNEGHYLGHITRHMLGIFHSQPGGKQFRRHLSENAHQKGAGVDVLKEALSRVEKISGTREPRPTGSKPVNGN